MSVESIHTSPEASGNMVSSSSVKLIAGVGIENDRYASKIGSYSVLKASTLHPGQAEPGRQVTLISADDLDAAVQRSGISLPNYGSLRRNIVVRGLPQPLAANMVGSAIQLGNSAIVFCHRHCVPCMYNERKNAIPGLVESLWEEAGVSCEVLVGGIINVGDEAQVLTETELHDKVGIVKRDAGHQPTGFFLRPTKRSASMVKDGLAGKKALYTELMEKDPSGVERLERSYNSVGLKFWPQAK